MGLNGTARKEIDPSQLEKRTEMDAFNSSSYYKKAPEILFGTSARGSLVNPNNTPGPGQYRMKSTMDKQMWSDLKTPCKFSLRSRQKFGDPNEKTMNKDAANAPGPGSYQLTGKFLSGKNSRDIKFPKGAEQVSKDVLGPGPGSYTHPDSMGKQVLSTRKTPSQIPFGSEERKGMAVKGASDVGPGEYGPLRSACDTQVESTKTTAGQIKFGTGYKKIKEQKKIDMREPSPGPGSYRLPGGLGTTGKGQPYPNSRGASMSGRNKFGSPFGQ